ncbi:MAG: hypothetical protein FWF46_02905 [Oscillospiraceae bacterium]|nr:hypothetical protein [Oscillospiraceae bacterium]
MMNLRKNKGITLIALIITIIVMLILAGVAISSITGTGIFSKTKEATDAYNNSVNNENNQINTALGWFDNTNSGSNDNGESGDETLALAPKVSEPSSSQTGGNIVTTTNSTGVIEIVWLDMNNNVIANPLPPKMASDMTPIKYDGTTEETAGTYNNPDNNWYSYTAQTGSTDGQTSNWANAKTNADGSYWVWIPRYAYRIVYFDGKDHANDYRENGYTETNKAWIQGYSTVYGMVDASGNLVNGTNPNIAPADRVQTAGYTDYIPHPAFLGSAYIDLGGGFGDAKGISGFWVAKFEASQEDNKPASKPGVSPWTNIAVGDCYTNSLNYNPTNNSHLIKNSEWGATAYLTDSKYGRNGTEVTINDYYVGATNSSITGGGTGTTYATTKTVQSTTGNPTGIYDLNGGVYEYIAAFNKIGNPSYLSSYASSFASANGNSTKYATAYSNLNTSYDYSIAGDVSHVGDGMREVAVSNNTGWFSDYSTFVYYGFPFTGRGGYYGGNSSAGIFAFGTITRWWHLVLQLPHGISPTVVLYQN